MRAIRRACWFDLIQGPCQTQRFTGCPWHERCSLLAGTAVNETVNAPAELEVFRVPLIKNRYGKGRARVMRIHRDGDRHEVSQLNVKAMVEGDFARAYTDADNSTSVSSDTIKNVVNVVAR